MLPETEQLLKDSKIELQTVLQRINRLNPENTYTAQVAKSFHLGMVGGSGRNNYRLNKRREREMEKSIANSKELVKLYNRRDYLNQLIPSIESGEYERKIQEKADKKEKTNTALVEYWNSIKVGDKIDIGGNSLVEVTKKNKKSLETGSGCKWTVAEIIGKQAASLIK